MSALVLDIGSSSVRCSAFPDVANPVSTYTARRTVSLSPMGTFDALELLKAAQECATECVAFTLDARRAAAGGGAGGSELGEGDSEAPVFDAVAFDCFAMSLLGVDEHGEPVTPVLTYVQGEGRQDRRPARGE